MMDKTKVVEELVKIAKELTAGQVYDVSKYMNWALEDVKPMDLIIHTVKARIKVANEATLDKQVKSSLDKAFKSVVKLESQYKELVKTIKRV